MAFSLSTFAQVTEESFSAEPVYEPLSTSTSSGIDASVIIFGTLFVLVVAILGIIGMWKVFAKAGRPGWHAIVPFLNLYTLSEIAGRPGWLGLAAVGVAFIPFVGSIASAVIALFISLGVAEKFRKSAAFGVVGLWLFSAIGYLMLGFGKDTYDPARGPQGTLGASPTPPTSSPSAAPPAPPASSPPTAPPETPPTTSPDVPPTAPTVQ